VASRSGTGEIQGAQRTRGPGVSQAKLRVHCLKKTSSTKPEVFSLVVLETAVFVSRPKFCDLGLGLEASVSAVFETGR